MLKKISVFSIALLTLWACSDDSYVNSTNNETEKVSSSQGVSSSSFVIR